MRKTLITTLLIASISIVAYARCATVGVRAMNPTVNRGDNEVLAGLVTNCDTKQAKLTVSTSIVTACNETVALSDASHVTQAGASFFVTVLYPVAGDACVGTYRVRMSVSQGKSELGVAQTSFEVK